MLKFNVKGDFKNTERRLQRLAKGDVFSTLDSYGKEGVAALQSATPSETGATASAWSYQILKESGKYTIAWTNSVDAGGTPLVILLQYGHGTGTGGYVQGRDFINPAIQPIFDRILTEVRKVVSS